jgi:hypothetical protein
MSAAQWWSTRLASPRRPSGIDFGGRRIAAMRNSAPSHPYDLLTPQRLLDALDAVGFRGDGRIVQLNSYENRVFQVMLEDGSAVVAKFYRPLRWTDAQILEEHRFALELAASEIPVIAPLPLTTDGDGGPSLLGDPPTLAALAHDAGMFRYAVYPRRSGHGPELEMTCCAGSGVSSGACMRSAQDRSSRCVARWIDCVGYQPLERLLEGESIPPEHRDSFQRRCTEALATINLAFASAGRTPAAPARRLSPGQHPLARRGPACRRSGRLLQRTGDPGPVDAAVGRARGDARATGVRARRLYAVHALRPAPDCADRAAAHIAHDPPQRMACRTMVRPGSPDRVSVVRQRELLVAADRTDPRSNRRDSEPAPTQPIWVDAGASNRLTLHVLPDRPAAAFGQPGLIEQDVREVVEARRRFGFA